MHVFRQAVKLEYACRSIVGGFPLQGINFPWQSKDQEVMQSMVVMSHHMTCLLGVVGKP